MKILSPWPWPQGHPRGGDGADKNFRPISTIMPNMNEIHQRIFKIWGLINFNAKTLTLWRKDERTNELTNAGTNVGTNERTDERKSENYIPPHTSYVGGYNNLWGKTNLLNLPVNKNLNTFLHTYVSLFFLAARFHVYHIYPVSWYTLIPFHTCPKIWPGPFNYLLKCPKTVGWVTNNADADRVLLPLIQVYTFPLICPSE